MMRYYLKMRFRAKETKITTVILLLYSSIAYFNPNILVRTAWGSNPSFYLANYAGFFFWFAALFFIVPVYAVYLQPNYNYFHNINVIYRYGSLIRYWHTRVKIAFLESSLFVSFLYLLMIIRAAYFHQLYHYIENRSFFLKSFCLQICAFALFAVLYSFFSDIFNKPMLGFACAYLLFAYDFIAVNTGLPQIYILCAISLRPEDLTIYWPIFLMLLVLLIAFTILGWVLLSWKDNYQKVILK